MCEKYNNLLYTVQDSDPHLQFDSSKYPQITHIFSVFREFDQDQKASHSLDVYEGTYGNFLYGNLTIVRNDSLGLLQMRMGPLGLWNLYPTGVRDHHFAADGIDHMWPIDTTAWFGYGDSDDCDDCALMTVTLNFEPAAPPVFERDLKMADAPAPPQTECAPGGVGGVVQLDVKAFTVLFCLTFLFLRFVRS